MAGKTLHALTMKTVYFVMASTKIRAWSTATFINIFLAIFAGEPRQTLAHKIIHQIDTHRVVLTLWKSRSEKIAIVNVFLAKVSSESLAAFTLETWVLDWQRGSNYFLELRVFNADRLIQARAGLANCSFYVARVTFVCWRTLAVPRTDQV
jgi:hypothetical protein